MKYYTTIYEEGKPIKYRIKRRPYGRFTFVDENEEMFFRGIWFIRWYGINKAVGTDGKHYKYSLLNRTIEEIEKEPCKEGYWGGMCMKLPNGQWW